MKKYLVSSVIIIIAVALISWGRTGHSTIGRIAENHLNPKAKEAINLLLGGQSLADVASWADDTRDRSTASWHFINVPLGLSFADFKTQVEDSGVENVYTALVKQEAILADVSKSNDERATALKYVIHFAGDIHQPMHVSRAEDKGGNTIQVRYDGQGTNFHSLWDTKMLEHAGRNDLQLAEKFDHATPVQIKKWQADAQIIWAWESYQISTQLYAEVAAMKGNAIDNTYYDAHLPVIENQIEKAGIRLAGVLNSIFANSTVNSSVPQQKTASIEDVPSIKIEDAGKHINEMVKICAKAYGHKDFSSMVLVNMGAAYPDQLLTIVLRGDARKLEDAIDNKLICVSGKIILYNNKPEIVITEPDQIKGL